jgi:peptide/nickel transport system permease protein
MSADIAFSRRALGSALEERVRRFRRSVLGRAIFSRLGFTGLTLMIAVAAIAVAGPAFARHSEFELVAAPYQLPSAGYALGTDYIGRDALSRFLLGGRVLLAAATCATVLAVGTGIVFGLVAGYWRGRAPDLIIVGLADLLISFPPIILALVVIAGVGSSTAIIVIVIAAVQAPRVVRLVRAASVDIVTNEYVEAAVMRGEGLVHLLFREILPNIWPPVIADLGIRFSICTIIFASLSFLGLGPPPPTADWGVMIGENKAGLLIQPWVVLVPAIAIITFTVGVNIVGDAISQAFGRSSAGTEF